jgi:GAF domain-containing protein
MALGTRVLHRDNETFLLGKLFYQKLPASDERKYPLFISIPIPLRSFNASKEMPEIGALTISARPRDLKSTPLVSSDVFTQDRIEMLNTLSDLLAVILTSSSALGNPRGSWIDN